MRHALTLAVAASVVASLGAVHAAEFRTRDPVGAFVRMEYALGDDYFIRGNRDTHIFRCLLTREADGIEGVALSEISIWGNRAGPWEIFRREADGSFVYVDTRFLTQTACLETCRSKDYWKSGRCRWEPGWPR